MAGWGIQDNKPVATLQWFYKQYIDYAACRAKLTPGNLKLLSNDKFCTIDVQSELSYVFISLTPAMLMLPIRIALNVITLYCGCPMNISLTQNEIIKLWIC